MTDTPLRIPVCEPYLDGNERKYVLDCIETNWIGSQGKYISAFEKAWAEYCGVRHAVTATSGTTALHLALAAIGIGPGCEVIVPTFTMAASALAVVYTGAVPVFVDCTPDTFNIDPNRIAPALTEHTRAIMPVHLYGHLCDMDAIQRALDIPGVHGRLWVIEDAAEAHGATVTLHGPSGEPILHRAGCLGDVGCFSFYSNKIIAAGELGALVTDNGFIAERARYLKDLAHSPQRRFYHPDVGYNYRATNIACAIALAQLERIDEYIRRRREHAEQYTSRLKDIHCIVTPVERRDYTNVYWMYTILLPSQAMRDGLMHWLAARGIQTRAFFIPMHQQPAFRKYVREGQQFPVADDISGRGMYLPSGTGLTEQQIDEVCAVIHQFIEGAHTNTGGAHT